MSVAFVTPLAHPSRRCGGLGWKLVCGLLPWLVAASTSVAAQADPGYVGVVFARKTVELAAETSGTLTDVHVRLGDEVEEHQVLLTLEAPGLDQEIRGAAASVRAARAEAGKSEAELEEAGRLLDRRQNTSEVFTQEEIESLAARKAVAEANREMARSRLAAREATLRELQERKEAL
ncbi:MAG: biotin/lipoyl-binding protein, partial [Candidatus Krumholzibacteriia bacterium]